jgi:hypothetical protein
MVAFSSPDSFRSGDSDAILQGHCKKISTTSFSGSQFQAESNGGIFVTKLLFVPEIATLPGTGVVKKFR